VQEVYDKKVLHRLVGVPPKASVVQDVPQHNGAVRSNGGIIQSAWEPIERSQETDDDGHARKPESSTTARSREVIDVDANDEESRYEIPRKKRRRIEQVIADIVFTTDEGSEGDEVIVIESSEEGGSLAEEEAEYGMGEMKEGGQVRINRKRAFWAAKAGTSAGPGNVNGNVA
jgi:non-canonical poly(A) RNA polymerase PAPD5/7